MVLAHYFREEGYEKGLKLGREKARAEGRKEGEAIGLAKAREESRAEIEELCWRLNEVEHKKMQAELEELRKRVEALEAARGKQADG